MPLEDSAIKRQIQRGDQIECKFLYKDMLLNIMRKEGPFVIGPGQEVTTPITSSAMLTWSRPVGQDRATPVQESRGIKIKMSGPL